MDIEVLILLLAAIVGMAGVVLHFVGYIPRPYRRRLQKTEAVLDSVRSEIAGLNVTVPAAIRDELGKFTVPDVGPTLQALGQAIVSLPETIQNGMAMALASVGAADIAPKAVEARQLSSFAKVGAKKLALAAAGGFHPAAGVGLSLLNAAGIVDDATLEKFAELLVDNPDLLAKLNAFGQKLAEKRGLGGEKYGLTR